MGDVTSLKGIGDVRTALSTRLHSKPAQKGTAHRDLYLLGKEKEREEKEIARLERQQRRVKEHLAETVQIIARLQQEAQTEDQVLEIAPDPAAGNRRARAPEYTRRQWKTMPLEY